VLKCSSIVAKPSDRLGKILRRISESVEQTTKEAERIWDEIDHPNLKENIEPTKYRARLILEKGSDHSIQSVLLRKV
jgi:type I pantothenate kinase